jgi:hypothetical protein
MRRACAAPPPDAATRAMRWYCVRVGLAMGASSLLELATEHCDAAAKFFPEPMALLAPVMAGITAAPPHLGACLRASSQLCTGLLIAAPVACAALAAVGWSSDAAVFSSLTVLTLLVLLLPATPPLSVKVALIVITVSLFSAPLDPGFSALFPVQVALASLIGQAVALALCALPLWPGGRACDCARDALREGEAAAGALGAALAREWDGSSGGCGGSAAAAAVAAARERTDALHATLAASAAALRALREGVDWEARAGLAPPWRLAQRCAALEALLLSANGMRLALDADAAAARVRHRGASSLEAAPAGEARTAGCARAARRRVAAHVAALGDAAAAALSAAAADAAAPNNTPAQQQQQRWRWGVQPSVSRVSLTSAAAVAVDASSSSSAAALSLDVEVGAPHAAARAALASFDDALAPAKREAHEDAAHSQWCAAALLL